MSNVQSRASRSQSLERLGAFPRVRFGMYPTPLEELRHLPQLAAWRGRLLVKRDDAMSFAFGGNKIRKMEYVAAAARAARADTLVTMGGVQSNHARVVTAVAVRLGMRCVLVTNGEPSTVTTANALLNDLLGAERVYVGRREDRAPAMAQVMRDLADDGARPFAVPLGASTGLGALGFVEAVRELLQQIPAPDLIVHAASSGGTCAGLIAGCRLLGLRTRILAVSADDPAPAITTEVERILGEIDDLLDSRCLEDALAGCEITDGFVGAGYGIPSAASADALQTCARTEALFLDPTYTSKAMAALLQRIGEGSIDQTIVFWHTGGQVALFR